MKTSSCNIIRDFRQFRRVEMRSGTTCAIGRMLGGAPSPP